MAFGLLVCYCKECKIDTVHHLKDDVWVCWCGCEIKILPVKEVES